MTRFWIVAYVSYREMAGDYDRPTLGGFRYAYGSLDEACSIADRMAELEPNKDVVVLEARYCVRGGVELTRETDLPMPRRKEPAR